MVPSRYRLRQDKWWPEPVVCPHSATSVCVVAGTGYRHTCSGGGQRQQQGSGTTLGTLAAASALAADRYSVVSGSLNRCTHGSGGQGRESAWQHAGA